MTIEKLYLKAKLELSRCPVCNVSLPHLIKIWGPLETHDYKGANRRFWAIYKCETCGSLVMAFSHNASDGVVSKIFPKQITIDDSIPERAREYLNQAIESMHAPAGAVILAASAVDSMLKAKNYKEGSLYSRIEKASENHLITKEMSDWAHEIRLDANEQRHADEQKPLPSSDDASRSIEFALALAEFLFVLPARVERGRHVKKET